MRADAELHVATGQRVRWRSAPPLVLRRTGPAEMYLVQSAGGPLGGDHLTLRVRLAADTELTVRSAAATIAQPGPAGAGPARWTLHAELETGARLYWFPEPTVVCDDAELHATLRIELAAGAFALVREQVLLGRHGELGGRYRGVLVVDHADTPLLRHTTVLDGADAGLTGPAGIGGAAAVGSLLLAGGCRAPSAGPAGERPGVRWAVSRLAGPGALLLAVGELASVTSVLADASATATRDLVEPDRLTATR